MLPLKMKSILLNDQDREVVTENKGEKGGDEKPVDEGINYKLVVVLLRFVRIKHRRGWYSSTALEPRNKSWIKMDTIRHNGCRHSLQNFPTTNESLYATTTTVPLP
jgi:hypothetical protein